MRLVVLAFAVVALMERAAVACSCMAPKPPCEAMWNVGAVFVGEVTGLAHDKGMLHATVHVDASFRGTPASNVVVVDTGESGGACGYEFKKGEKYIIYADTSGGGYATGMCMGTKPLADAKADLAYGSAMPKRARAVVEGQVVLETAGGPVNQGGVEVLAHATGTTSGWLVSGSARTSADGKYHLDLAPGTYELDVNVKGLRVRANDKPTVSLLAAAACASREIDLAYDGRIRGRIVDAAGKAVAKVSVGVDAAQGTPMKWRVESWSDANGNYELAEVQPGKWYVGANIKANGGPSDGSPYPETYYPGVAAMAKATVIDLGVSGIREHVDFVVPEALAVYEVTGVVRHRNGKPYPNAWIQIDNATFHRGFAPTVDDQGNYKHRDLAGSKLTLRVCVRRDPAQAKCKEIERKLDGPLQLDLMEP